MSFEFSDIKKDMLVNNFVRSRSTKDVTKAIYIRRIRKYCNFLNKSPTELIEEAEKEEESGIRLPRRKVNNYILNYIEFLEEESNSNHTIKSHVETVKGFYNYYDIKLQKFKLSNTDPSYVYEELPSQDHIREALKVCGIRDKAIILLMYSSGMGASEIRSLTYIDFLKALSDYLDLDEFDTLDVKKLVKKIRSIDETLGPIATWKIKRIKTNLPYITFSSPESVLAIADYLIDRDRKNTKIESLNSPLFVTNRNNPISPQGFVFIFRRINDAAKFGRSKDRNRRFFTSHMLRKLFTTTLYSNGVDKTRVDFLLGHKIDKITEAYFKADEKALKKDYTKSVEHLTLQKVKIKTVTTKEYDALLKKLQSKDKKMDKMDKRLELLEKLLTDKEYAKDI